MMTTRLSTSTKRAHRHCFVESRYSGVRSIWLLVADSIPAINLVF